jgi:general secretion pathway protein B
MSYILEALKKAEQKTQQEGVPKLLSFPDESAPERGKRPLWPYLLLAALFLNAGVLFLWIGPWRSQDRQTVAQVPVVHPPVAVAPVEAPVGIKEQSPSSAAKEMPQPRGVSKPRALVVGEEGSDAPPPATEKRPVPVTSSPSAQPKARVENKPAAQGRVVRLNDLPPSVRGALPDFNVTGHAYSPDPRSRVTRINDQILQEGQALRPGLKVDEITPDGIVLSYQGHRFNIGIGGN